MIFTGVDEAGLGPVLGPFCASSVSFSCGGLNMPDFSRDLKQYGLRFEDSKKIFNQNTGIRLLEENVLALVYAYLDFLPETILCFYEELGLSEKNFKNIPWYENIAGFSLPLRADLDKVKLKAGYFSSILSKTHIELKNIALIAVGAKEFNALIDIYQNKASAVRECLKPLFRLNLDYEEELNIVADCQGGRRYYDDWLNIVFPELVFERKDLGASSYSSGKIDICFEIKADAKFLVVSMASMIAKYTRELFMTVFNSYWNRLNAKIKKTAGYPLDGKRFLRDLREFGLLPGNEDDLIRKR